MPHHQATQEDELDKDGQLETNEPEHDTDVIEQEAPETKPKKNRSNDAIVITDFIFTLITLCILYLLFEMTVSIMKPEMLYSFKWVTGSALPSLNASFFSFLDRI